MAASKDEESPSTIGHGRWLTASGGNFKESATEIDRITQGWKGEVRAHRRFGDKPVL